MENYARIGINITTINNYTVLGLPREIGTKCDEHLAIYHCHDYVEIYAAQKITLNVWEKSNFKCTRRSKSKNVNIVQTVSAEIHVKYMRMAADGGFLNSFQYSGQNDISIVEKYSAHPWQKEVWDNFGHNFFA